MPTPWLATSLAWVASSSPWDWVVALLQVLKGKDDQEGSQLGMGCGPDLDGDTVVGWKECEIWLPGGWISMVSDVEFRLEPPDTIPRYTGAV